jgi:hypothetical protein
MPLNIISTACHLTTTYYPLPAASNYPMVDYGLDKQHQDEEWIIGNNN